MDICQRACKDFKRSWTIFVSLFDFHNPPELEFGFKAKLPFTDGGSEPSSSEIDSSYPTR